MKYEDLDNIAEQLDREAEEALEVLKHHPPQNESDHYSRFGGMSVDLKNLALGGVSLNTLNDWVKDMSVGAEVVEVQGKIAILQEARDRAYNIANDKIRALEDEIKKIKKEGVVNQDGERISKILSQAIDQSPEQIALNAKNLLTSDRCDLMVDVNQIDELTSNEKEALYNQYIREQQIMAGIIQPEA